MKFKAAGSPVPLAITLGRARSLIRCVSKFRGHGVHTAGTRVEQRCCSDRQTPAACFRSLAVSDRSDTGYIPQRRHLSVRQKHRARPTCGPRCRK